MVHTSSACEAAAVFEEECRVTAASLKALLVPYDASTGRSGGGGTAYAAIGGGGDSLLVRCR